MNSLWRRWWRPSLTGRVVKALLIAFGLVFLVLVAYDYFEYRKVLANMEPLQHAAQALADALPSDEPGAMLVARSTEQQYNMLRKRTGPVGLTLGDLLFEVSVASTSKPIYVSQPLATTALALQSASTMHLKVSDRIYTSVQGMNAQWRVRVLQPELGDLAALKWIGKNLLVSMLIAFPVVLLPLWLAVRRGLSPLRTLVSRVTQRGPGDFSPLEVELRYAELQPLAKAINELYGQSRDALTRERALVQDAAHEMRTPLAVIATQAHALVVLPPGLEQQQAFKRLELAIARASHQVHQLLTLARLEGTAVRVPTLLDCVETARQGLIDVEPRARMLGVDLSLEAPESLAALLDQVAFHSVLDNLIGNALNHAKGATRVQVSLDTHGNALGLRVADDGAGVPIEDRPHLFDRFHRGQQATTHGSGLGLSIVREAARLMGGDVRVFAGLDGRGVAFEMRVPWRHEPH